MVLQDIKLEVQAATEQSAGVEAADEAADEVAAGSLLMEEQISTLDADSTCHPFAQVSILPASKK